MRRGNLADEVADHIRDSILTGRLRPGTRIDQDAIARDMGVSRLPVREALISLDQEGLVRTLPRHLDDWAIVGTPQHVRETIARYRERLGITHQHVLRVGRRIVRCFALPMHAQIGHQALKACRGQLRRRAELDPVDLRG